MHRTRKASTEAKTSQPPPHDHAAAPGLQMRAAFRPGTINAEDRTVEVVFGSDAPVRMYTWEYGPINEELSFDTEHVRLNRLNNGAPVLDNHDAYGSVLDTVVGVVEKAWTDGKKGYAKLRFAKTDKAKKVMEMASDGILQNVSVGYAVYRYKRTKANEEGKLDNYRAVDWEPHEISMVAVPADADAKVRSLAGPEKELAIEDENIPGGTTDTRDMGMDMSEIEETPAMTGGQIEYCTEAIDELNEQINSCLLCATTYPENADKYNAIAEAHKAAIAAYTEIIAAVNGQRTTNSIINQRKQELAFLKARF